MLFYSSLSFAQDSTKVAEKPFYIGKFQLNNPNSIVHKYTYDSKSNTYIYTEKAGNFNIIYPKTLTVAQYQKLIMQESMSSYFKDKLDAIASVKANSKVKQKNLLPEMYVNGNFFKSIFGGNTVEVIPKGSLSLDLGVNYSKRDNPAISPQNRTSVTPLFDQRISLSMLGKVGTRLKVNANFDTEASFEFQNLMKLEFDPNAGLDDDGILRKIEVGDVSMPLNSSLITGAQSLFGFKTQLQFGKTTVTAVMSKQRSETKTITAQGDGKLEEFERYAIDYDNDRHFFLAQYFRENYDKALAEYPFIRSKIKITKIEVWKTNRTTQTENIRNIVALQDIGESNPANIGLDTPPAGFILIPNTYPDNSVNGFNPETIGAGSILTSGIRDIATVSTAFPGTTANQGLDYVMLENAKKLNPSEYKVNPELGYITLNGRLNNDEVLAVAFQYTVGSQVYQVGEFATDGIDSPNNLVVKLLRSNISNVNEPLWDLMMKNIYTIGYQLEEEDFKLNILYSEAGVPINYLTETTATLPADVRDKVLLKVFNLDRLNFNNDPQQGGDGFFDFMQGITVDKQNGRIIFTSTEPFGEYLFNKLRTSALEDYDNIATYNANQLKYVYRQMYKESKANALQNAELNKFMLKGKYKSTGANGISLGVYNVPRGSVHVTAGGRTLQEGVDYVVNYQMGKVQILDPSLQNSTTPVRVSMENTAVFSQQRKSFTGINIEHKFSDKIMLGATYLHLNETPITKATSYGLESVNNTIFGLNAAYSNEVPFLTRLANKLPNIDTDATSNFSFSGEFAYLKPGSPKKSEINGEATTYVDDFEGAQTAIELKSPLAWKLASTPAYIFPEGILVNDLDYGKNRAKLAWYTIDFNIYGSRRPDNITDNEVSQNETRSIRINELFPQVDIAAGTTTILPTLDLAYYPDERGAYNYDVNNVDPGTGKFINPTSRWGGITRSLTTTDFEQANVEYIEFWMLDPYTNNLGATGGELHFNLGSISEDILADRRKFYENGLPGDGAATSLATAWSKMPDNQSLIYAFDTDEAHRAYQDVGYDGYSTAEELTQYAAYLAGLSGAALSQAQEDPSNDDYKYYLDIDSPSILERYKKINGVEGNSPISNTNQTQGGVTIPDVEDVNRDQTMNTIESFFDYTVPLHPNMTIADRYVADIKETDVVAQNGATIQARWIQFKIPIYNMDNVTAYGGISDFRSIRFMRMFLKDFDEPVVLRFGKLELVRGDWRRYRYTLDPLDPNPNDDNTEVDVNAVNIFENEGRQPIPYVLPPGIVRDEQYQNQTVVRQNEQSLSMKVCELEKTDSRGVYKNISIDMRQYKRLKMFIHMEEMDGQPLSDDDLIGFLRIGSDMVDNYYQIELPLKLTPWGSSSDTEIWPEDNQIDLALKLLNDVKLKRIENNLATNVVQWFDEDVLDPSAATKPNKLKIGIKGNPDFGNVRMLMVGIKNAGNGDKCGEAWFDELRLASLSNEGGWAAISTIDANLADFATMSLTGKMSTIGFGEIQQRPNERSIENSKQYDFVTNVNVGQLLPKKWKINFPINYAISEQFIDPQYDPILRDVKITDRLNIAQDQAERDSINGVAQNYTRRKSINVIGLKKGKNPKNKPHFYDVSNFTFSYSYNEMNHHDFEVESYTDKNVRVSSDYAFTFKPLTFKPFSKTKKLKSKHWKFIKDFNLNLLPTSIAFTSSINRQFNAQQYRELEDFGIGLDKLYKRNFMADYAVSVTYDLTKSIKLNYQNANHNIIKNYIDDDGNTVDGITVWDGFWNLGEPNHHHTSLGFNYKLPFKKIPALNFIDATYSYTGDFDWQKGSDALKSIKVDPTDPNSPTFDLGNTIQNANTQNVNLTLNMKTFYRNIGIDKLRRKNRGRKKSTKPKKNEKVLKSTKNKVTIKKKNTSRRKKVTFKTVALDLLTSLKTVSFTYKKTSGIALPGYLQNAGYFGTFDPTFDFVMGSRTDIRNASAANGYLTQYPDFTQPYTERSSEFLDFKAVVEPIRGLKINITANKDYADNFSEQYKIVGGQYNSLSPNTYGNFSMSMNMLRTAFDESNADNSVTYDQFRANRIVIAQRLAGDPINPNATVYPDGYGASNQAVLLPAFFAAYSGQDATKVEMSAFRDIPLPNWKITYSGFTKIKWFKKHFKRIALSHGYRSSYTINQFRTNLEYVQNPGGRDASNNFLNETLFSNINMVEQFNPLVKVDMEFKSSLKLKAELKTDRTLNMSFDNNMLTEINGKEYIFGMGYRIKNLKFKTKFAGKKVTLKGDLNIKADLKLRNNLTVIRNLEASNNQITGGQNMWGLKVTADYNLTRSLSAKFFYDHSFSKFAISTAFPTTNVRSGISITYKLGN
jgi:cell surface protein SprA